MGISYCHVALLYLVVSTSVLASDEDYPGTNLDHGDYAGFWRSDSGQGSFRNLLIRRDGSISIDMVVSDRWYTLTADSFEVLDGDLFVAKLSDSEGEQNWKLVLSGWKLPHTKLMYGHD